LFKNSKKRNLTQKGMHCGHFIRERLLEKGPFLPPMGTVIAHSHEFTFHGKKSHLSFGFLSLKTGRKSTENFYTSIRNS